MAQLLPRVAQGLGIKEEHLRLRDHKPRSSAAIPTAPTDFEYLFPVRWGELWGVADRNGLRPEGAPDYSGKSMEYLEPVTKEKVDSVLLIGAVPRRGPRGVGLPVRSLLKSRSWRAATSHRACIFIRRLRRTSVAVLPLQKNKCGEKAGEIYELLSRKHLIGGLRRDRDTESGKRYRRASRTGTGTPMCITVDFAARSETSARSPCAAPPDTMEQDHGACGRKPGTPTSQKKIEY